MLYDGISLTENASIQNAAIDHGAVFPADTSVGELFFRSDLNKMFVHNGSAWEEVGATLNASTIATALGYTPASLDGSNKVPLAQLPAVAITDTFIVASQAAMLALSAQTGDIAIRSDLNKTYILQGSTAATLTDWKELLVSSSAAAAGANTQIQFNSSGVLGASANFTFNSGTGTLVLGSTTGTIVPSDTHGSIVIQGGSPGFDEGGTSGAVTVRGGSGLNSGSQGDNTFRGAVGGNLTLAGGNGGSNGSAYAGSGGNVVIAGGLRGTLGGGGTAGHIIHYTNNTERFRINPNGSWSVGDGGAATGTAGQVLTSNGSGAAPTWATPSGGSIPAGYSEGTSAITATATTTVNCATSNNFLVAMSANITSLLFSNIPASGNLYSVTLFLNYTGAFTITWPASLKWSGGAAPTLTSSANKTDIITLTTRDGGGTWYGFPAGLNF